MSASRVTRPWLLLLFFQLFDIFLELADVFLKRTNGVKQFSVCRLWLDLGVFFRTLALNQCP
ncbi:MAG: hypothetical protein ACYTDT_02880 [Planctomycetota bacterium]